jgi:hypothetical protein
MNELMTPVRDTSRYQRGKIYKLVNSVDDSIYVGSTCLALSSRFYAHKKVAKQKPLPCHRYFNTIGWDTVRIVLIENVIAEDRDQLIQREQYYIDLLRPSLNKQSAFVHCPHGRKHCECRDCNGVSICIHGLQKPQCRECGGSQICSHNRLKHRCIQCNGDKYHCYECDKTYCSKSQLKLHNKSKKHINTYRNMFLEVFGEDITDEEIIRVSTV